MIDREYFQQIKYGLVFAPDVEAYYRRLINFIQSPQNSNHPDFSEAINQVDWIEDQYHFKSEATSIPESQPKKKSLEEVIAEIDKIIDQDLTEVEAPPVINYVASQLGWRSHDLQKYYEQRKKYKEEEAFNSELQTEIHESLIMGNMDIDLSNFLPKELAAPLTLLSKNLQTRQAITLSVLLTGASVCHRVGTRICLDPTKGWREPPILYTLVISPSGQGKSPILIPLITQPFWAIQQEWKAKFNEAKADYYFELEKIKLLPKEEKPDAMRQLEEPPKQPRLIFASDPTVIGLNGQFEAYSEQGILGVYDEASKLFAFDRTSAGKSDKADILSFYNGLGVVELRKDGVRANVGECVFSILGLIQPDILLEIMGDCKDPSGQWARFLFCIQPLTAKKPSQDNVDLDIFDLMVKTYCKILARPKLAYFFNPQGRKLFEDYYYGEVEPLRIKSPSPGLQSLYGKAGGQVGRLALNLHALHGAFEIRDNCSEVPASIVEKAIALNRFYLKQTQVMHSRAQAYDDYAPAQMAMICQLAKEKGGITARDLNRNYRNFRNQDPSLIREWFKKLESMGKGRCSGNGSRLRFTSLL